MKTSLFVCFLLLFSFSSKSQCKTNYAVLSPSFYKYAKGDVGVGVEAGMLPVNAKGFLTLKANLWQTTYSAANNYKDGDAVYANTRNNSFIGLKYNYTPNAFEELPRKWTFGVGAGVLLQSKTAGQTALDLSSAYIIRMAAGNYNSGIGYVKFEAGCLLTPKSIQPDLGAGVFLLL